MARVNLGCDIGEGEGTYPNHCQKNADGGKNGLGRCRVQGLLGDIHGLDGRVQ